MSANEVMDRLTEALGPVFEENEQLKEGIAEVRAMLNYEVAEWQKMFGGGSDQVEGLDLEEVQSVSEKARKKVGVSSLPKRAADLHAGYVFGNGIEIEGTLREPNSKGAPPNRVKFFETPINQENLFSGAAKRELQYARFTDGNVIVFCNTKNREVRRVPIYEIKNALSNPDHPDEIWAWLREWNQVNSSGKTVLKQEWAYTNRLPSNVARQKTITVDGKPIPVAQDVTAVDLRANRQVGWTYGIPDALAGMHWAEAYGEVLRYGQIVNESLAKYVFKVVVKSQKGAKEVGVKTGSGGPGQGVALGEGQDIQLVNTSQRSFDFTAARPLAAMAAAAWNVSNIDLLSDSSAAGSSYGAAQSLTPGMQNAMNAMRQEWTQFYEDVFEVCGLGRPEIHWPPMEKPDAYRLAQELVLYSFALSDVEVRTVVLDRLDIAGNASEIPASLSARSEPAAVQAASPDQGQSNGTGGAPSGSKNDQRTDNISETLRRMQDQEYLERLESVAARIEAATVGNL